MIKILIVEDEKPIANLIKTNLIYANYTCECAYDGEEAITKINENTFDLILLDIMLPKVDGHELIKIIKPFEIPVIFLTAKFTVEDKVKGLKLGAEDYIVKPFEIIELLARVETVLRRYNKTVKIISIDDVIIDVEAYTVKKDNKYIDLTTKEFQLLILLVQNKNIALHRETIYERIWNEMYLSDSRTVDLHIQRLRKKLHWEDKIVSVYKVGYRFEDLK